MPACLNSTVSVRLSKKEQIAQRRALVLELSSRGYTQQEIADRMEGYHISRQSVSIDLKWLKDNSIEYVKNHRDDMAMEYRQVLSNLYQLRKKGWLLMEQAENKHNENLQRDMFAVIQSINADIINLRAIGDIVREDVIKQSKESAAEIQQKMEKALEQNHLRHSAAIF